MSGGMEWVRSKDCEGLLAMEKGRLIREFLEELKHTDNPLDHKFHWDVKKGYYWIGGIDMKNLRKKYEAKNKR